MELSLASLEPKRLGIDISTLQGKDDDMQAILHQEKMWICDMGASTNLMQSNKGARNVHDTMMYSLGHACSAMESTVFIDIPGVFVNKDSNVELKL